MRTRLAVSLGLLVSCGFAAASQGPTGASAEQDGDKPIVTQWKLPNEYDAAIFAYQEATQPYASELSAAVNDTPGWSGLQIDLDAKTIQVYVAESPPASLLALAEKAPLGLEVSVSRSQYSHDYLAKQVQGVFAADKRVTGVSIPVDGSGLRVGVDVPADQLADVSSEITRELPEPVRLTLFHDEGGGLYNGRQDDHAPFYGGAQLTYPNGADIGICTTGFAVRNGTSGNVAMLTAFHCRPDAGGEVDFRTPQNTLVGHTSVNHFAQHDARTIDGQTYNGRIYVGDGYSALSRTVTDVAPPLMGGQRFCLGGGLTGQVCNNELKDLDYYQPNGAGPFIVVLNLDGQLAAGEGDSGGPAYRIPRQGDAEVLGLIVGPRYPLTQSQCPLPFNSRLCSDRIIVNVFRRFGPQMNLQLERA